MAHLNVAQGPSKFDLMTSLFEVNSQTHKWVTFHARWGHDIREKTFPIQARIIGVEQEDGSGESWNITFCDQSNRFGTGYYSTKTRKGVLELEDDDTEVK